ncbi:unnamed protein product [Rhizopus stolonifer]
MPEFEYNWDTLIASSEQMTSCSNTLLRVEYSYNCTSETQLYEERYDVMNADQKSAFDTIIASIEGLSENTSEIRPSFSSCFFLQGPADTGKHLFITFFDEVLMQNKLCFEAVDLTLQDIRNNDKLFGGVPVVFGGSFA